MDTSNERTTYERKRRYALRDDLFSQVALTARHATVDLRGRFGESDVAGQAQMLELAIASGLATDDIDRLLRSLLALRHDGRFGCTCDDAEAVNAIVAYAQQNATPPNFSATVALPAAPPERRSVAFSSYRKTEQTFKVGLERLARGPGNVTLHKSGVGTLHYAVALCYRVPDTSAGAYAGLRIDRIVRAATAQGPLVTFALAGPATAPRFPAGRVYDVEDRIVTDHPVENVVIDDPLPAGLEAVDRTFRTAAPVDRSGGGDTWVVDYQAIQRER